MTKIFLYTEFYKYKRINYHDLFEYWTTGVQSNILRISEKVREHGKNQGLGALKAAPPLEPALKVQKHAALAPAKKEKITQNLPSWHKKKI